MAKKLTKKPAQQKKTPEEGRIIQLPKLRECRMRVDVVGLSSYIQNKITQEALDAIVGEREKGGKQTTGKKAKEQPPLDVDAEVKSKLHVMEYAWKNGEGGEIDWDKCKFGIPIASLQKTLVRAAYLVNGISYKQTNAALFVEGHNGGSHVPIEYKELTHRRGHGTQNRSFFVFHQPVFNGWKASFFIRYDEALIDEATVLDLVRHAGAKVGIGNNRRENGGEAGSFAIAGMQAMGPVG